MAYKLGIRSRLALRGVHPDLVRLTEAAVARSEVDFRVTEGVRPEARQAALYAAGASRTQNSRHLTGHAVDVAALVAGAVRWELNLYYQIAEAFRDASRDIGVPVEWGACWRLIGKIDDLPAAVGDYVTRCRARGRKAFVDGPHFQLPRAIYPDSVTATQQPARPSPTPP